MSQISCATDHRFTRTKGQMQMGDYHCLSSIHRVKKDKSNMNPYLTMLVSDWLGQKVKCNVNLCFSLIPTNLHKCQVPIFVADSHQTRLDTRSKARRPIKVRIKGRLGMSRDSNPAGLCCSSAHFVQCEPDEASSFMNPNVGPGTYASLRFKLDARSSAIRRLQRRQKLQFAHPEVA